MHYDFSNMGENIARLRHRLGMTQEVLADKLGVTSQAVSKWERQLSYPDLALLPEVAEVFGVSIDELFVCDSTDEAVWMPEPLPWPDDRRVRVAVFEGKRLCTREVYECPSEGDLVLVIRHGETRRSTTMEAMTKTKTPPE